MRRLAFAALLALSGCAGATTVPEVVTTTTTVPTTTTTLPPTTTTASPWATGLDDVAGTPAEVFAEAREAKARR